MGRFHTRRALGRTSVLALWLARPMDPVLPIGAEVLPGTVLQTLPRNTLTSPNAVCTGRLRAYLAQSELIPRLGLAQVQGYAVLPRKLEASGPAWGEGFMVQESLDG